MMTQANHSRGLSTIRRAPIRSGHRQFVSSFTSCRPGERWQRRFLLFVCLPLLICWLYCAALLRNFYLVEEITLLPEVAPTRIKLKVRFSPSQRRSRP